MAVAATLGGSMQRMVQPEMPTPSAVEMVEEAEAAKPVEQAVEMEAMAVRLAAVREEGERAITTPLAPAVLEELAKLGFGRFNEWTDSKKPSRTIGAGWAEGRLPTVRQCW